MLRTPSRQCRRESRPKLRAPPTAGSSHHVHEHHPSSPCAPGTPEKIYRAFLDPDAMAKWLPPNGFTGKVHHMDAKVGGTYKMSFTNFTTGTSHSFGGEYLELTPHERIRYTDKFDDPNLPGEMQTTIDLKQVSCGTELNIVQEGMPAAIPAEACYLGWQESLSAAGETRRGGDSGLAAGCVGARVSGARAGNVRARPHRASTLETSLPHSRNVKAFQAAPVTIMFGSNVDRQMVAAPQCRRAARHNRGPRRP